MGRISKKRFAAGCMIILLYIFYHLYVYADVGETTAEFLIIPAGARPAACAGAFTGIADDISSLGYNPAGLGTINTIEMLLMHSIWLVDTTYDYGACAFPAGPGAFGISVAYVNAGDMNGRDNMGNKTRDFTASDIAAGVGYGYGLNEGVQVGILGKFIHQTIDDTSRSGGALDAGVLWEMLPETFSAGVSVLNLGPKLAAFESEEETLPTTYRLGIGYYLLEGDLLYAGDLRLIANGKPSFCSGVEYRAGNYCRLRCGMEAGSEKEKKLMWTAGIGFAVKEYGIDYCYEPFGELDDTHRFSMTLKF